MTCPANPDDKLPSLFWNGREWSADPTPIQDFTGQRSASDLLIGMLIGAIALALMIGFMFWIFN